MEKTNNITGDEDYKLWKFFKDEHDLILTDGQITDIVIEVEKLTIPVVSKSLLHNDNENWEDVVSGYSLCQNLNDAQEHILNDLIKFLNKEYTDTFTK